MRIFLTIFISLSIFLTSSAHKFISDDHDEVDSDITIAPTQVTEYVIVNPGDDVEAVVLILNLYGTEIIRTHITGKTSIELDDVSEGIYFIKVKAGSKELLKRIIVKR